MNFRYNPIIQKLSIKVQEECKLDISSSGIRYSLGYHPTKMVLGNSEEISQNMVSSNPSQNVCTDIVENQYVGEMKAPLLRMIFT